MVKIRRVTSVTNTQTAILDLIQRVELLERTLKIKTLTEQESSPLRVYLRSLGITGI